jgi:hypothetical protein
MNTINTTYWIEAILKSIKLYLRATILIPVILHGQEEYLLPRLNGSIELDGFSEEVAWNEIDPLPMTMYTPTFGGEPSERTEVRIAYDDNYIYVSGRLYDSDPNGIQANSLVRDRDRGGDFFNFLIDTYNDNETFLGFFTTPAGNRLDAEIINDAEGEVEEDFFNKDWNGFWDNAVVQNKKGWFVEMRIPFSSLRFQDNNGNIVFGIMVHRLINRNNERLTYPAIPPKWETGQWKASNAQDVVLKGIFSHMPLQITPYGLGGVKQSNETDTVDREYKHKDTFTKELGFDIKYGLTNSFTLDLTANTDFAQVEADDELINLTRFPLFFPEKRQFFQERSGIFSFKTGAVSRLFHSRRIGISENGELVRILGGARLVGRTGLLDIGFLDMQTDAYNGLTGENFSVLRLRRRTFNQYSYLGVMITNRLSNYGNYNTAAGIDGVVRISTDNYLTINLVETFDKEKKDLFNSSLLRGVWENRSSQGLGYSVEVVRAGEEYNPAVGFINRLNYTKIKNNILYGYYFNERSVFFKHTPQLSSNIFIGNTSGLIETAQHQAKWIISLKAGSYGYIAVNREYERIDEQFNLLGKIEIPAGNYTFHNFEAFYSMPASTPLHTNINFVTGPFYDGNQTSFIITPTWNQSRHFELGGEYEFDRIRFPERNQNIDVNILRLKFLFALNIHLFSSGFVQYNSTEDKIGINVRFRYNFQEGRDIYLVYNETLNTDLYRFAVTLPTFENRQILLKYSYTLLY